MFAFGFLGGLLLVVYVFGADADADADFGCVRFLLALLFTVAVVRLLVFVALATDGVLASSV